MIFITWEYLIKSLSNFLKIKTCSFLYLIKRHNKFASRGPLCLRKTSYADILAHSDSFWQDCFLFLFWRQTVWKWPVLFFSTLKQIYLDREFISLKKKRHQLEHAQSRAILFSRWKSSSPPRSCTEASGGRHLLGFESLAPICLLFPLLAISLFENLL